MAGLAKSSSRSEMNSSWMTWQDVLLQCLQPMLAIVLLLRFSSIVDEAGFVVTLLLVFITFLISFVTAWSACTVVSRKNSDGGFLKTLISYSSPQFATSFSLLHLIALIMATSIFVTSGAEAVLHIFSTFSFDIFDGATHDLRIVSAVLSVIVLIFCLIRNRNGRHTRFFILVLTIIAVALHLSGVLFRYGEYQLRRVPEKNVLIAAPSNAEISTIFAQLFPAAICALTILNFSPKLQSSAPRGSLLAIAIAAAIYGAAAMFDYVEFFARATPNATQNGEPKQQFEHLSYIYTTVPMAIVITISCIMSGVSTLKYSSNILRSLCRFSQNSNLLWLSRSYGSRDIPLRCLLIISIFQTSISLIGSYDILCIPTTVLFLVIYALFNFYVFRVKLSDTAIPSPPPLVSLLISTLCIFLAMFTNRHLAFIGGFIFAFCYCAQMYIQRDKEASERVEKTSKYIPVLEQMHELQQEPDNNRHYHPQILLLSGSPTVRPALVDFAHSITRGKSLLICGYVIPQKPCSRSYLLQLKIDKQINDFLRNREINAFGSAICCENQSDGANTLLQTVGLGRLRPNILMVGFKTNWNKLGVANLQVVNDYYGMLSNAFEKQVGLIVFRNEISGFDVSSSIRNKGEPINNDEELAEYVESQSIPSTSDLPQLPIQEKRIGAHRGKILSSMQTTFRKMSMAATRDLEGGAGGKRFQVNASQQSGSKNQDETLIIEQMFRFRKRIPNARIDVYWLREAGGLTMLVPYLLTQVGSFLEGAHIRVFTKTDSDKDNMRKINEEQKTMAAVLRKFKIDSTDLHILPEFHKSPSQKMLDKFNSKIKEFKVPRGIDKMPGMFDDDELFNLRGKTRNYLRAAELITEHSSDADLIVCTLPSARPEIPATLYLTWIDILSQQTPPTCLIRGNQVSINALKLKFP
ncbi:unnamed protein product [Caenorhabditis angaria]|uniref:SLC12A transporter C-terminal domain-containing protein n=1 Tax=Caenorhabditis angaria TaxID=860376 RepID=A0A9P1IJ39_9PELO|nr:unnamed protein product [Caenorhabditis angaria]